MQGCRVFVSIPNGKPGPLRHSADAQTSEQTALVSIPNGKPGPLRHMATGACTSFMRSFQSQTGSQALSDGACDVFCVIVCYCFNPKREARPSQTALTHLEESVMWAVSIPNGKPGPLRLTPETVIKREDVGFNPKREARPSQTRLILDVAVRRVTGFNPKREARPSQTLPSGCQRSG